MEERSRLMVLLSRVLLAVAILVTFGLGVVTISGCAASVGGDPTPGIGHDLDPVCGNGRLEDGEQCDRGDLDGESCLSVTGRAHGALSCTGECGLDTSGCHTCGDGVLEPAEECEPGTLERASCADFGFESGSPYCSDGCRVAGCWTCGDGECGAADGESVYRCPQDCGGWLDLAAGAAHTCAVTQSGNVWCWGDNGSGQLGRGGTGQGREPVAPDEPARAEGISGAVAVSAGMSHTCGLQADGEVLCWGSNLACQLGLGEPDPEGPPGSRLRLVPTPVPGLGEAVSMSAGGDHSCAVLVDGSVWCWGRNAVGQIGDGTHEDRCTPTRVVGLAAAQAVFAGRSTTCALIQSQELWCWGANDVGQLGIGELEGPETRAGYAHSSVPVRVGSLGRVEDVALGTAHVCAVSSTDRAEHAVSEALCWGLNRDGQLGDGVSHESCDGVDCSATPVRPALSRQASRVAAGANHSCAMLQDGNLYCWGANDLGQLGSLEPGECSPEPVRVPGLTSLRLLAVGDDHGCAVTADRTLWCWGDNEHGQVGGPGAVVTEPRAVFDSIVR